MLERNIKALNKALFFIFNFHYDNSVTYFLTLESKAIILKVTMVSYGGDVFCQRVHLKT